MAGAHDDLGGNDDPFGRFQTPLAAAFGLAVTLPQPRPSAIHQRRQILARMYRHFRLGHLGQGANVYLSSAELAAVVAIVGKIPTRDEYMRYARDLSANASDIYRYLSFDKMKKYARRAR